jgi:enterobactin synthetase component D / holo-[acyl-carrier protein] synthase
MSLPTDTPARSTPFGPPSRLFPAGVEAVFTDGTVDPPELPRVEAAAIRNAVPSRQREFSLGRWCARRALAQLGIAAPTIPVASNRAPVWPDGVVGSITHCKGFVGAVVARDDRLRSIGFDAELAEPLASDLVRLICTPSEIAWIESIAEQSVEQSAAQSPAPQLDWPKAMFSAKEAVYKCIAPVFGRMLDFLDVTLTIDVESLAFTVASHEIDLGAVRGRIAVSSEFVFACAFMPRRAPSGDEVRDALRAEARAEARAET